MAIYDTRRSTSIPFSTLAATTVVSAAYNLLAWVNDRRTRARLAELPDHILRDIGLTRGDIARFEHRS